MKVYIGLPDICELPGFAFVKTFNVQFHNKKDKIMAKLTLEDGEDQSISRIAKRIVRAKQEVIKLCKSRDQFRMSIPVDDEDSDIVLMEALNSGAEMLNRLQVAQYKIGDLREMLDADDIRYRRIVAELTLILKVIEEGQK